MGDGKIKVLAQLTRERAAFLMTDIGLNVDAVLTGSVEGLLKEGNQI